MICSDTDCRDMSDFIEFDNKKTLMARRIPSLTTQSSNNKLESSAQITIVGIGTFGSNIVNELAVNIREVSCFEVLFENIAHDMFNVTDLLATAQKSDLLFIVSDFTGHQSVLIIDRLAELSRNAGVLTVGLAPVSDELQTYPPEYLSERLRFIDTLFLIPSREYEGLIKDNVGQKYDLVQHLIAQTISSISNMITQQSMIGIDFADVMAILKSGNVIGKFAKIGVGVVDCEERAEAATMIALDSLHVQQVNTCEAAGVIACLQGSSLMTYDDFDAASKIINDNIHENSRILIGFISDESMGRNISVTMMTVLKA